MSHLYQCISPPTSISVTPYLGQFQVSGVSIAWHCQLYQQHHQPPPPLSPNLFPILGLHSKVSSQSPHGRRKAQPHIGLSGQKKERYLTCFFGLVVTFLFARTIKPFACLTMIPVLWQFLNNIPIIHSFSETRLSFNDENHQVRL